MEGGGEEEHAVGQRWTRPETVVLASALKAREEEAHDVAAKSAVGTASDKWETVSKFCRSHGVSRSSAQCNSRWSKGLFLDYKKVRDWQKNEGVESYWKMKEKKRREHKLPGSLDEEVFNILVSFLDPDLKQTGTPESEVDSDRPASHVVSPASAIHLAEADHPSGPSAPVSGSAPSIHSGSSDGAGSMSEFAWLQPRTTSGDVLKSRGRVPSGDDKTLAAPSQKRRRASTASPIAAPATTAAAERVDNAADAIKIKPIHFNVPPNLEIPRFGDPNAAERISTPQWDGQPSLGSLEGRLLAQNEAVWNRVRILNEQVVQMVEMSNQRLLSQMQTQFTQIRLQIQVFNAQMQAKVQEATQSLQAELQTALKAHTEQLFNQLHAHGPSAAGSHPSFLARGHQPLVPTEKPTTQNGNWPASSESAPMPTPPDIHVDFSHLPVPPLQPLRMPAREKERIVRQRTTGPEQQEGLPAPLRTSNRLLPHISDFQRAEAANKSSRLPPHISDVDRMLRQQHQQQQQQQPPIPLPSPLPSWNQASFVISELDRVLGQKPLDIHMIPPAPGPTTYAQAPGSVKLEKVLVPSVSPHMGLNMGHSYQHPGHHFLARESAVESANRRHSWSEGIAMPGTTLSGNPNQSVETSSGQDVEPSSRNPASSSGTVDGEETTQDSGQDTGAASSEKPGGGASDDNHRESQRGGPRGARGQLLHPNNRGPRQL